MAPKKPKKQGSKRKTMSKASARTNRGSAALRKRRSEIARKAGMASAKARRTQQRKAGRSSTPTSAPPATPA